ncbi:haloacid dehalogenase [Hanstruepera neustonica]|uniref:Haloacid dehalogenase n=1 Tax=Hanstruepera neustonica TaxID=1445657 RepID=A0A2K1E1C3_9FLAO|nr:HAD family hydrolase [Hanstruepera neustonica]PNQ74071.1 haloacid dehalogenase [Hanstruepera neustonica]
MKIKNLVSILLITIIAFGCKNNTTNGIVVSGDNIEVYKEEVSDPLPSWNESNSKSAIIAFVEDVTNSNSANFIPIPDRIATFDNDGNLWSEQPAYFQLFFAIDRVKALAPEHPEWKDQQPYKAILEDDMKALMESGMKGIVEIIMATHAGVTVEEFDSIVKDWVKNAKHPTKNVGYNELVYQPMLELLQYLRANDFKTYIVSGGGVDFMRAIVTEVYGIPNEQILGSRVKTEYDYNNGNPIIKRLPGLDYNDDKEGKPLNIQKIIGKKPVFASGNSDGDLQMMQWTDSNSYKSFQLYLHHTDAEREWAYDRESHIGQLNKGLDEALEKGWTIIDMKNDWKVIYPFELK